MNLDKQSFEGTVKDKKVGLYRLRNANGTEVAITNYGARIVALVVRDKSGKPVDVVTGFDSLDGYLQAKETFHGAIVGRYANRIARGQLRLNGKEYQLAVNNPPNHLHGGPDGFHNQVWEVIEADEQMLLLSYHSPDGEENYPGNLDVRLRYRLTDADAIELEYEARTDAPTVFNITSHPFFNLNGQGIGDINRHLLWVAADRYTPVDAGLIPTGIEPVDGTPFDFREATPIGQRVNDEHLQLMYGAGYDHNFVLNGSGYRHVATATGDVSGIAMEVWTDQPGMQLYGGNFMKGEHRIKYGLSDPYRGAFCLETQHYPDSPNHPDFPSTVLEPGQIFRSKTAYRFR